MYSYEYNDMRSTIILSNISGVDFADGDKIFKVYMIGNPTGYFQVPVNLYEDFMDKLVVNLKDKGGIKYNAKVSKD